MGQALHSAWHPVTRGCSGYHGQGCRRWPRELGCVTHTGKTRDLEGPSSLSLWGGHSVGLALRPRGEALGKEIRAWTRKTLDPHCSVRSPSLGVFRQQLHHNLTEKPVECL